MLRKARKTKSENDWSRYNTLRSQCNNLLKKSGSQYNNNLIEENSLNPKKFWKYVKDVFPTKQSVSRASLHQDRNRKL